MALVRTGVLFRKITPFVTRSVSGFHKYEKTGQFFKKLNLENKIAAITGGASGIGYAIAKAFLNEGMPAISLIDKDKEKLECVAKELTQEFGEDKVLDLEADVGDIEQMDGALRNTSLHYQTIDIIVNNAGVMNDGKWENEIKTNINGCVIGTLLGMQYMAKSSSGSGGIIVNMGSIMSIIPSSGMPIYTMTQFAIAGFSEALGSSNLYQRTGVKIFGYCPGITDTPLMKEVAPKCINPNFAYEFQEEIVNCTVQSPDHVAKCLVNILDEAKPGSLWVTENGGEPYEAELRGKVKHLPEKWKIIDEN